MSYGRFPPYGPGHYPPSAYYGRPRPHPPSARPPHDTLSAWPTPAFPHSSHPPAPEGAPSHWPAVTDDPHQTPFGNHPASNYPEDELAYLPSAHPTPWAALPRDFHLDEPGWGHAAARTGAFPPGNWYSYPPGADHITARRPYAQLDHFSQNLDQRQSRLRWREEILEGNPEKSMADHAIETSTLVISFITRGPADHPHGQGDEILFFKARRKDPTPYQHQQDLRAPWSFLALEASPLVPLDSNEVIATPEQLSRKSITGLIPTLDIDKDLKLIRRSKPLRWDSTTVLESFLYRLQSDKENLDSEASKDLEDRLGQDLHYWTEIKGFQHGVESEIVSTAMIAVCFPAAISAGIDDIFADMTSRAEDLSQKALDVLYFCVQGGYARTGFRYYPIPPPPNGQQELEICAKRRVWAYWTQVVAWHLSRVRADAQVSISYTLLKALTAVKPSLDDMKVTIADLEKLLVNAIATEADRSRNAARILMREGVSEILYNRALAPDVAPGSELLQKMHIITTSSSSIVYNVIAKLITHVLSRKPNSPGGGNSSANRHVMDLRVTIAESRPLCEGVAVAIRLNQLVDSFTGYREKSSKSNKRVSTGVPSIADLGTSALDSGIQARMRQIMMETDLRGGLSALSPGGQAQSLGLAHLLADMDAKKEKKEPKVTIELITDAAVVSNVMASGASGVKPLILLSGDRILSNGDVVNKVGSAQMAWAGKLSGGAVLILSRADRVHSKDLPPPGKPSNSGNELIEAWKVTAGSEEVDQLVSAGHVSISNPLYEDVGHEHVTGYITELGLMEHDMLCEFANIRLDLEKAIWG